MRGRGLTAGLRSTRGAAESRPCARRLLVACASRGAAESEWRARVRQRVRALRRGAQGADEDASLRRRRFCSCRNSRCLKLYCECFASNDHCDALCNCQGCMNKPEFESLRRQSIETVLFRNPHAFRPKIAHVAASPLQLDGAARPVHHRVSGRGREGAVRSRADRAPAARAGLQLSQVALSEGLLRVLPGARAVRRELPLRRLPQL